VDGGRIFGAQATTKGKPAFDALRRKLFERFGVPTDDSDSPAPDTKWDWSKHGTLIELSYNANHDQTTLAVTQQE
jgi:hypothetical protein